MAVVEMCDTTIPKLVPPFLRYIQYDAIAIDLTDEQFAGLQAGLSKLSGSRQPCDNKKRIEAKKLKEVFEKGTGGGTTESCRAILTKSQYQDLLEYLQENEYYYQSYGNASEVDAVLALSYGEMPDVNLVIACEIESEFWSESQSRFRVPIYAQWEIADALWMCRSSLKVSDLCSYASPKPGSQAQVIKEQESMNIYRIGLDVNDNKNYIRTEDVVEKSKAKLTGKVALACQSWHAPRCYHECKHLDLDVVAGLFAGEFSPKDTQPWVRDVLSWIIKENDSWRRRKAIWNQTSPE